MPHTNILMFVGALSLKMKGDFMKNILNNKILIISFIFIIFLSFFTSSVFADFTFLDKNNVSHLVKDLPFDTSKYDFVIWNVNGLYWCTSINTANTGVVYSDTGSSLSFSGRSTGVCNVYSLKNNAWVLYGSYPRNVGGWTGISFSINSRSDILYSTVDIYSFYSSTGHLSGDVVFQKTPVTVGEITIPEITQVVEIPQLMGEILKILIPIGLIIFGIGLVIYLVRLLISRVT